MTSIQGPTLLSKDHVVRLFDCGNTPLNAFLQQHAMANQANGSARTFVALENECVLGYYSLAVSSLTHSDAPLRMAKGLARHPIPILLIARLAVDQKYQGLGIAKGLFKDALKRAVTVSHEAGVRAIMTHAKDENAKRFYLRFGMEECPQNPLHLYLLMKDVEASLR